MNHAVLLMGGRSSGRLTLLLLGTCLCIAMLACLPSVALASEATAPDGLAALDGGTGSEIELEDTESGQGEKPLESQQTGDASLSEATGAAATDLADDQGDSDAPAPDEGLAPIQNEPASQEATDGQQADEVLELPGSDQAAIPAVEEGRVIEEECD